MTMMQQSILIEYRKVDCCSLKKIERTKEKIQSMAGIVGCFMRYLLFLIGSLSSIRIAMGVGFPSVIKWKRCYTENGECKQCNYSYS